MNQKKAKQLRREVKALGLKASVLLKHVKTGQIRRGPGERAVLQNIKHAITGKHTAHPSIPKLGALA